MPWEGSDRKARLPPDWEQRRRGALARCGGRCEFRFPNGGRCSRPATDVDHIIPGDDHSPENLQGLCGDHHARKSSREGNAARAAVVASKKRPPERHPGERRVR